MKKIIFLVILALCLLWGGSFGNAAGNSSTEVSPHLVIMPFTNPVKLNTEGRWHFTLVFEELNGVGIKINELERTLYNLQGQVAKIDRLNGDALLKYFPKVDIRGNDWFYRGFAFNRQPYSGVEFRFIGQDEKNKPFSARIRIDFSQEIESDTLKNPNFDNKTLRSEAVFRVEVSPGIYWVPAGLLGKPQYTEAELLSFAKNPELLQTKISTVYDLIHYIQASQMVTVISNLRIEESGISWEHPRPADFSITHNESNCVGISQVANYILKGDYEEVGFIEYGREDGGGHIFSYVKMNQKFYIFDLTPYKMDDLRVATESGQSSDYYKGSCTANIHETDSLEAFVKYYQKQNDLNNNVIFISYTGNEGMPIGSVRKGSVMEYCFPTEYNVTVLFDYPRDGVVIRRVPGPKKVAHYK